jgi:hypothetical protein
VASDMAMQDSTTTGWHNAAPTLSRAVLFFIRNAPSMTPSLWLGCSSQCGLSWRHSPPSLPPWRSPHPPLSSLSASLSYFPQWQRPPWSHTPPSPHWIRVFPLSPTHTGEGGRLPPQTVSCRARAAPSTTNKTHIMCLFYCNSCHVAKATQQHPNQSNTGLIFMN